MQVESCVFTEITDLVFSSGMFTNGVIAKDISLSDEQVAELALRYAAMYVQKGLQIAEIIDTQYTGSNVSSWEIGCGFGLPSLFLTKLPNFDVHAFDVRQVFLLYGLELSKIIGQRSFYQHHHFYEWKHEWNPRNSLTNLLIADQLLSEDKESSFECNVVRFAVHKRTDLAIIPYIADADMNHRTQIYRKMLLEGGYHLEEYEIKGLTLQRMILAKL
ncbi:MAG: hypothetical protein ABIJ34_08630 [archaeon]